MIEGNRERWIESIKIILDVIITLSTAFRSHRRESINEIVCGKFSKYY